MQKLLLLFLFISTSVFGQKNFALAIHGGAGTITRANLTQEMEAAYRVELQKAMDAGYLVLENGGEAKAAVVAAIQVMEASPLFNSGVGAVFTHEGRNELDASIMDGKDRSAGAVAGVSHIKSPIAAAKTVMEQSDHVLLAGKGAEEFAKEKGLTMVDSSYFFTERRWNSLQKILDKEKTELDHDAAPEKPKTKEDKSSSLIYSVPEDYKFGTVGCVALDAAGNIAAGTSTGGMTNKRWNRIGDSPIIGAGTYADNATCAVSCTGHGEYFIRSVVAYDVAAIMKYTGKSLNEAANEVVKEKLVEMGGTGGLIAIDAKGNISMPFNTAGMYRGYRKSDGSSYIGIYKD